MTGIKCLYFGFFVSLALYVVQLVLLLVLSLLECYCLHVQAPLFLLQQACSY